PAALSSRVPPTAVLCTLSLHDALPIYARAFVERRRLGAAKLRVEDRLGRLGCIGAGRGASPDPVPQRLFRRLADEHGELGAAERGELGECGATPTSDEPRADAPVEGGGPRRGRARPAA